MLLDLVRDDPVCRRFMTVPGVGAIVAITFQATVDIPQRFTSSKAVGAHFGLTPQRLYWSHLTMRRRIDASDTL
jgi:transposase